MKKINISQIKLIQNTENQFIEDNDWAGFPPFTLGNSAYYSSPTISKWTLLSEKNIWNNFPIYYFENQVIIHFSKIPSKEKIDEIFTFFQNDFSEKKLSVLWNISGETLKKNIEFSQFLREKWYEKSKKTLSIWIEITEKNIYTLPFISAISAQYILCNEFIFKEIQSIFALIELKTISGKKTPLL